MELRNDSDRTHALQISVTNEADEVLYDETVTLEPQMANEGVEPFRGEPSQLTLTLQGESSIKTEWPSWVIKIDNGTEKRRRSGCGIESNRRISRMFIYILGSDHFGIQPTCSTPQ